MSASLSLWSRAGRYLAAAAAGLVAWGVTAAVWLSEPLTVAQEDVVGAVLFVDLVVGVVALALLALRRRHPLATACLTTGLTVVSVTAMGPATLAVVSLATRRRRSRVAVVAVVFLAAGLLAEGVYRPRFSPVDDGPYAAAVGLLLAGMLFAASVATGYYVGARRELVTSLQARVRGDEREQALTLAVARDAERTRIAREMHDVLAHRISLVALHAGALLYREDLTRAQTAATAETIQANAQLALTELREVLGVLRAGHRAEDAELPQPTLTELPALLADAREADVDVRLDTSGLHREADPPDLLSRTAFRVVQEALTNARKHAPGGWVEVRLAGAPGADLRVEVRNPVGTTAGPALPSARVGLAGLTERAELTGGTLAYGEHDGLFVLRVELPWPR